MKGDLTIKHDAYFQPLRLLSNALYEGKIPYALIGGGAVQATLASILSGNGEDFRRVTALGDHLRPTGDIDILIGGDQGEALRAFNELAGEYHRQTREKVSIAPNYIKLGRVHINPAFAGHTHKGLDSEAERIFESAIERTLRAGANKAYVMTESPEYLIAAKLTGQKIRAKDEFDIARLARYAEPDRKAIEEILIRIGRKDALDAYDCLAQMQVPKS